MKIMIKVFNLTALAVVGAIVFPGAYGNTMRIKSFAREQHADEAHHQGGSTSQSVFRGTESEIDPPKPRKIKVTKKASSTVPRTFASHLEYLEWLRTLDWPKHPEVFGYRRRLENDQEQQVYVPQFPGGVYDDPTQLYNLTYIEGIRERCLRIHKSNITIEGQLACHMYFPPEPAGINLSETRLPYALGTITLETNRFNALQKGTYLAGTVNQLFNPNAMAMMIKRGCFSLTTDYTGSTDKTTSYVDSETYKHANSNSDSDSVSGSLSYGPFSINAGYSQQVKKQGGASSKRKVAYQSGIWSANIGTITNLCLQNPLYFHKIKDLFDPSVVQKWKAIINSGVAYSEPGFHGAASSDFNDVAMGGVLIPTSYNYGAIAKYVITATYDATSASAASTASKTISAGAKAALGSGSGGIQSKVDTAINTENSSSEIDMKTVAWYHTIGRFHGTAVQDLSLKAVEAVRTEQRKDINKLGAPTGVNAYIDLARIVNMYINCNSTESGQGSGSCSENGPALGDTFKRYMENEFAYYECEDQSYTYYTGFGKVINDSQSCWPVDCLSAMSIYPSKKNAPENPSSPCLANGGTNATNPSMAPNVCNLNQCSIDGYYDDAVNYCYTTRGTSPDYCWYPTLQYPVGSDWTFGGARGLCNCGSKCTTVCDQLNTHC